MTTFKVHVPGGEILRFSLDCTCTLDEVRSHIPQPPARIFCKSHRVGGWEAGACTCQRGLRAVRFFAVFLCVTRFRQIWTTRATTSPWHPRATCSKLGVALATKNRSTCTLRPPPPPPPPRPSTPPHQCPPKRCRPTHSTKRPSSLRRPRRALPTMLRPTLPLLQQYLRTTRCRHSCTWPTRPKARSCSAGSGSLPPWPRACSGRSWQAVLVLVLVVVCHPTWRRCWAVCCRRSRLTTATTPLRLHRKQKRQLL